MLSVFKSAIITSIFIKEGVTMKTFLQKYKHAWVFLYGFIYLPWFYYLEKHVTKNYHVIHIALDDKLPFMEWFIIPYFLWFPFVAAVVLYFFFKDTDEFYKVIKFLVVGMTIFLVFSTIFPNGQQLRPTVFERDNIFVDMVRNLYKTDTPTNIFPSIHVYNTLGVYIAVRTSKHLQEKRWIQIGNLVLSVSIILSTVLLKQHSILDVVGAGIIAAPTYYLAYIAEPKKVHAFQKAHV